MPLNVRRFSTLALLVVIGFVVFADAQTLPPPIVPQVAAPTSGDIMRDRISKAKAFIAVRNYNAAIFELENIRKETADTAVQGVVNVLLMNSYLEQGDYKRAQDFLNEYFAAQKTTKANASAFYTSIAGQVVKDAKNRVDRYRALGLSVTDKTLPLEALNDLDKMRETLEIVITQSKEIGKTPAKSSDALALLEEASKSRSIIARDDFDARRWKNEVADSREQMSSSRTVVTSAVTEMPNGDLVAANTNMMPPPSPVISQPVVETKPAVTREREVKPVVISSAPPTSSTKPKDEPKSVPNNDAVKPVANDGLPLDVGSLVPYATKQAPPVYPPAAKTTRTTGIVKVEFTVNEQGEVDKVQKTSGPSMLQGAARDAIKKWRFKPFTRDGQPVKANGFVSFNFAL